jgi:hypothetical protein
MNTKGFDHLVKLMLEEVNNLKKYASEFELDQLHAGIIIIPMDARMCIYGHMTGNCESERAIELINQCCSERISNISFFKKEYIDLEDFTKNERQDNRSVRKSDNYRFSPLESFLWYATEEEIVSVIHYLNGQSDKLCTFNTKNWKYNNDEETAYDV